MERTLRFSDIHHKRTLLQWKKKKSYVFCMQKLKHSGEKKGYVDFLTTNTVVVIFSTKNLKLAVICHNLKEYTTRMHSKIS